METRFLYYTTLVGWTFYFYLNYRLKIIDKRNVMRETFRFKFLSEILEFYFIL